MIATGVKKEIIKEVALVTESGSTQDFLNDASCPFNDHLNLRTRGIVWRCQANVITIDAVRTTVARHQRDSILRLEAGDVNSPCQLLSRGISLLRFLILDKFKLCRVSKVEGLGSCGKLTAQNSPLPRISPT